MKGREEEEKKEVRQMRRGGKRSDWKVTGQPLCMKGLQQCVQINEDYAGSPLPVGQKFYHENYIPVFHWCIGLHWEKKKLDKWGVCAISVFLVDNMPLADYSSIGDGGANADYPVEYHIILYIILWSLHSHWCILVYLPSFDIQKYVVNKLLIWKMEESAKNWYPDFHIIA